MGYVHAFWKTKEVKEKWEKEREQSPQDLKKFGEWWKITITRRSPYTWADTGQPDIQFRESNAATKGTFQNLFFIEIHKSISNLESGNANYITDFRHPMIFKLQNSPQEGCIVADQNVDCENYGEKLEVWSIDAT